MKAQPDRIWDQERSFPYLEKCFVVEVAFEQNPEVEVGFGEEEKAWEKQTITGQTLPH